MVAELKGAIAGEMRTICRADVVREVRSWIGTPYHHQASCKGAGADCLGLVRGVMRTLYGCEPETAPAYSPDWGEANAQETLLAAASRNLVRRDIVAVRAGHVLVFRMRRGAIAKHAAIMTGENLMVHAVERVGVAEAPIGLWWRRRIAGAFSFHGIDD